MLQREAVCIAFSPRTFFHTVHRKLREIAKQPQAFTTSFNFLALHKTQRTVNHQMCLQSRGVALSFYSRVGIGDCSCECRATKF
jgi:hypothetical protein